MSIDVVEVVIWRESSVSGGSGAVQMFRSEERFSRNAETDLVCRLLLEKKKTADEVARRIKFQVHTEVGLTASVGAATSKLVAKVASGTRKPDGLVLVPPCTEAHFLAPLPIGVIPGLGPKTEERLHAIGLRNVGALAAYETQRLVQALGTNGAVLQR